MKRRLIRAAVLLLLTTVIVLGLAKAGVEVYAGYEVRAAEQLLGHQNYLAAKPHLEKAVKARPNSAVLRLRLGRVCRQAGLLDEAEEQLERCRQLEGQSEDYQLEMLMLQAQRGQFEAVYEKLWVYVEKDRPQAPLVLEALAESYVSQQLSSPGMMCVKKWLDKQPKNVQALFLEGWCFMEMGAVQEATEPLKQALAIDPERDDIRQNLAMVLGEAQRFTEAAALHEAYLKKHPNDPTALLGLARCRFNQGDSETAQQLLDEAIQEDSQNAELLTERGKLALHLKRNEEALHWLQKALKIDPNNLVANYQLELCYHALGRTEDEARLNSENRRRNADMERVTKIMSDELGKNPGAPLLHELGTLLLRNGRDQGLQWLYRALALNPNYLPTNEYLADYWEKKGDREKAAMHKARLPRKDEEATTTP